MSSKHKGGALLKPSLPQQKEPAVTLSTVYRSQMIQLQ